MKKGKRFGLEICDTNLYGRRKKILKKLGFSAYREYLQSDLWQEINEKMFYYYGERCFCCKRRNHLAIHHEKYTEENMSSKSLEHLFLLCRKCHYITEFKGYNKRKFPLKINVSNKREIYINV